MKLIKTIFLLSIVGSLIGCGTSKLYKGDTQVDKNIAKVWNTSLIIDGPAGFIRILKIGDHELTTFGGREYAFLPGEYDVEIFYQRTLCAVNCYTVGGNKTYYLKLKMEAGQTYLPTASDTSVPPQQACILGEPHDAPGHVVNITKEYRAPSKNAKIVTCSKNNG